PLSLPASLLPAYKSPLKDYCTRLHENTQYQDFNNSDSPCDGGCDRPGYKLIFRLFYTQCPVYNPEITVVEVSEEQGAHAACDGAQCGIHTCRDDDRRRDTCSRCHGNCS